MHGGEPRGAEHNRAVADLTACDSVSEGPGASRKTIVQMVNPVFEASANLSTFRSSRRAKSAFASIVSRPRTVAKERRPTTSLRSVGRRLRSAVVSCRGVVKRPAIARGIAVVEGCAWAHARSPMGSVGAGRTASRTCVMTELVLSTLQHVRRMPNVWPTPAWGANAPATIPPMNRLTPSARIPNATTCVSSLAKRTGVSFRPVVSRTTTALEPRLSATKDSASNA